MKASTAVMAVARTETGWRQGVVGRVRVVGLAADMLGCVPLCGLLLV